MYPGSVNHPIVSLVYQPPSRLQWDSPVEHQQVQLLLLHAIQMRTWGGRRTIFRNTGNGQFYRHQG